MSHFALCERRLRLALSVTNDDFYYRLMVKEKEKRKMMVLNT